MAIERMTKDGKVKFSSKYTKYGDVSPRPPNYVVQQPLEKPNGPVANKHVKSIALSIATEIQRQVDQRVKDIMEGGGKDEWIAYMRSEVEQYKQRAEELEVELECMRNAFPEHDNDVQPKTRGLFGA